jgi:hypothetical protein
MSKLIKHSSDINLDESEISNNSGMTNTSNIEDIINDNDTDNDTDKKKNKIEKIQQNEKKTYEIEVDEISTAKIEETKYIPFWYENPNILFDKNYIVEFFPVVDMTYEQKLNAVSRTIIFLTLIGLIVSRSFRILFIGSITLLSVFIMFYYNKKEKSKRNSAKVLEEIKENFENSSNILKDQDNPAKIILKEQKLPDSDDVFTKPSSNNPFSNVLLTDYDYNPNKKPAPPAFNKNVNRDIIKEAKMMINDIHPDQPNISDKLFKDLGEELEFEQSLRQFNSNPSTTIPNDQNAFAEFCYGSMISCKEGNLFSCARQKSNYNLY